MQDVAAILPQADRLELVRLAVEATALGIDSAEHVASRARVTTRYVQFALQAARLLGFLRENNASLALTAAGTQLLDAEAESEAERRCFRVALEDSPLRAVAPLVLGDERPEAADLADQLMASHTVARSTALRRARTLLSWRRYILAEEAARRSSTRSWEPLASASTQRPLPDSVPPPASGNDEPLGENAEVTAVEPETSVQLSAAESVSEPAPDSAPSEHSASPADSPLPAAQLQGETKTVAAEPPPVSNFSQHGVEELVNHNDVAYLKRHLEQGTLTLFTGAGFARGAFDLQGKPLPDANGFAAELWDLAYPGVSRDTSSLQDIFEHAQHLHRKALDKCLRGRFAVDASRLPSWYKSWFSLAWAKAYTLNVDDLADACERHFDLPREMRSVSGMQAASPALANFNGLQIVHLNGMAKDGVDGVTFAGQQYAERLARGEPFYLQLRAELLASPFVFVGSVLDESLLWQHIAIRGTRAEGEQELRPKSFLIAPDLPRARADKLRQHNIILIRATAQQFAEQIIPQLEDASSTGHRRLRGDDGAPRREETRVVELATVLLEPDRRTTFLLGAEPRWSDIRSGRAVERDHDRAVLADVLSFARECRGASAPLPVLVITGTAGAGKTTLLMKAGVHLSANGHRVAWIGSSAELGPRDITRFFRDHGRPPILCIDDAGRYGPQLPGLLADLAKVDDIRVLVIAMRAHHRSSLENSEQNALAIHTRQLGGLSDGDIDRLLAVFARERLLGALTGKPHAQQIAAFRDHAERQILVAMIEATSGERFEDKIVREWNDQSDLGKYVYALTALATKHGYPVDRAEIMLASAQAHPRAHELAVINKLTRANLLIEDDNKRLRVRHRVIADRLVDELTARGTQIENVLVGLCRAIAVGVSTDQQRASRRRRVLSRLLSHDTLLRWLTDVEPARSAYSQLEPYLEREHHFWLQRGCLELEAGELAFARNYLESARALNADDALVDTAFAHMQLRTAIANPAAPDAAKVVEEALEQLRRLIRARGKTDYRPAHIFGSQVLAWCRRAALTPRAKRELLSEAKEFLAVACATHRGGHELKSLYEALRKEELLPQ